MKIAGSVRVGVAGWLALAGAALGQGSTLPAAAPTAPATSPASGVASAGAARVQDAAKRARVTWAGGALTITADNSSINQILREVSRVTGMKVTGGVTDERVYGNYGPGTPGTVLASLLTGTGSNMLLKENAESGPVELVLSPRQGGATPPGPSSFGGRGDDREDDLPPQRTVPSSRQLQEMARPVFPDPPAAAAVGGTPAATQAGTGSDAAVPTPAATDQQSPNGVKTPQQIYDQLMQLQKQKAPTPPQ